MVEAAARAQRALAHGGVVESRAELAAVEAAHAARVALRAEPVGGVGGGPLQADAAGMEGP